jgi:hypothetical protein
VWIHTRNNIRNIKRVIILSSVVTSLVIDNNYHNNFDENFVFVLDSSWVAENSDSSPIRKLFIKIIVIYCLGRTINESSCKLC